jgi:hypothetical protein
MLRRASIEFEDALFHPPSHTTSAAQASYAGDWREQILWAFRPHRGLKGRFPVSTFTSRRWSEMGDFIHTVFAYCDLDDPRDPDAE